MNYNCKNLLCLRQRKVLALMGIILFFIPTKQANRVPQGSQNPFDPLPAYSNTIIVDGKLDDWKGISPIATDPKDLRNPQCDLKAFYKTVGVDKKGRKAIFYAIKTWGKIARIGHLKKTKGGILIELRWVLTNFSTRRTHSVNFSSYGFHVWCIDEKGQVAIDGPCKWQIEDYELVTDSIIEISIPLEQITKLKDYEGTPAQFHVDHGITLWSQEGVTDAVMPYNMLPNKISW